MKKWMLTTVLLTAAWVFVRGPAPENLPAEFLTGLIISTPLVYIFRRMYPGEIPSAEIIKDIGPVLSYIGKFIIEMLSANLDVAKRVIRPSIPMDPEIIEVDLRTENDTAITVLANSITLTPGTLTLDYSQENNQLLVHAMDGSDQEELLKPIRYWEDRLMEITGEKA
jgi:multicomponent Na+:H+ antiporter subunit E